MFTKKKKNSIENSNLEKNPVVMKVQEMYKNASNNKDSFVSQWKENYEAYKGTLFENKVNKEMGNVVSNHIFATVETIKPIMLTNNPKNIVLPKKEDGFFKAMLVQEALDYEWRRTRLIPQVLDSLTDGLVCGTFIIGLFWNAKANKGLGEIEPVIISPFNFFIDPMAKNIEGSEYCGYASYKSYGELVKAFPDKAEDLERQKVNTVDENLTYGANTDNVKNQILCIEMYMRDYATETYFEEEEEDGEVKKYKVTKMKYPNGRRVIIAGDILLSDGENPYDDGKFPFVAWKCYNIPGQFWGLSDVEPLVNVQKEICNLYNDITANAHLMGNPIWILDKNSGVEKNSLTNRKGLVIRKNPGSEVKRDAPPTIPAYVQSVLQDLKYDIQVISGVYDATRGERPVSITSGVAIQALQDSSQGRIKLKTQNLEYLLSDLGSMWLSRIQQFWKVPRQIRVMGGEYSPDSQPIIINGQPVTFKEIMSDDVDGDFDIEILTGSTMPSNKSAQLETILRLAQTPAEDGMPLVDRRVVLEHTEIDNVDDVIRRFEEQAQRQQQAQQQEAQMQQLMNAQAQEQANQAQLQQMQLNQKSQMEAKMLDISAKQVEKQMDIDGKIALQKEGNSLQSKIGDIDIENMTIEELLQFIQTLDEDGYNELIQKYPEILKVLTMIKENGMVQPTEDTKGGN